jgi:hypothetical protein
VVWNTTSGPGKDTAKPKADAKYSPTLICSVLTVWAVLGAVLALLFSNALILTLFLLPVVAYEIYRTRGKSTIFSSWALLIILILEIILIIFGISYDLGQYLGVANVWVGGQNIPLGDIKILGPTLLAAFSAILFTRTAGPYTKWLSVIIFASAFVLVYTLNPEIFKELLRATLWRLF